MEMLKRRLNMLFALFAFYSDALPVPGAFQCVFFVAVDNPSRIDCILQDILIDKYELLRNCVLLAFYNL